MSAVVGPGTSLTTSLAAILSESVTPRTFLTAIPSKSVIPCAAIVVSSESCITIFARLLTPLGYYCSKPCILRYYPLPNPPLCPLPVIWCFVFYSESFFYYSAQPFRY
ncbi:hypothetical protein C8Q70DRAFT_1055407 [Cubamyces menziesii]|nr:hypothetical protein C8Q70DRAFT_1055407 [Cubamyces menziesii]